MSSSLPFVQIGSSNRSNDMLRAEWWRTVNAVGNCILTLRNTDGKYNGVFDVQDTIVINITDPDGNNATMFRGRVDGGAAVQNRARDGESIWDEYMVIRGVDKWQDVLFHNDFEKAYPSSTNQIKDVLGDLFSVPKAIDTNIDYTTPVGATPTIGSVEFREGTSFLSTLQDALQKAGWISYVDDALTLQAGSPGFSATAEILTNTGANFNIIDIADLIEADGGKLYNYIKTRGKNPMFDGFTEENSATWSSLVGTTLSDDTNTVRVGTYSQRCTNGAVLTFLRHRLDLPAFNYTAFDFTKGELGCWAYYDNQAGGGGTPAAGTAPQTLRVLCRLTDGTGNFIDYYGESSRLYRGEWGWISYVLGERPDNNALTGTDKWIFPFAVGNFDWSDVRSMFFQAPQNAVVGFPSNFYIDGITMPLPVIGVSEVAGGAENSVYRRRPLPLSTPHLSTYSTIQKQAEQLLEQHEATNIDYLKLMVQGNVNLQYAGQSYTVNIPKLSLNNAIFYSTQIHHVIEPRVDVTDGFGFDYITEVEGSPIGGVAYDMSRLGDRQLYSSTQLTQFSGTGLNIK